jgi:hypothetical protein
MTQSTILASAQTAATTTTQTIAAGSTHTVGMFTADSGGVPSPVQMILQAVTPGNPRYLATISATTAAIQLNGPLQYTVSRPDISAYGINVGVWQES